MFFRVGMDPLRPAGDATLPPRFTTSVINVLATCGIRTTGDRTDRAAPAAAGRPVAVIAALALAAAGLAQADAVPVAVGLTAEQPIVEQVPVSGTVTSPRVARLSPEVAGHVSEVLVDTGDRVEAGTLLLQLDGTLAGLDGEAAEAATAQAREELADARRRLADAERLAESRGVPATEVEARRSEVRADIAEVNRRVAEQRLAEERLARHALGAPFSGVISRKSTESGEWVTPGDEVLELVADTGLRVDFQVPQAYFPRISAGTPIELGLDALPGRPIATAVTAVIPVSDPSARTFGIRVDLGQAPLPLTPGMSASGLLALNDGDTGVVVSRDALLRHPDGRVTVWVVEDDGHAVHVTERRVETGPSFDGLVVIRRGLEAGTRVVVEGNEALRQGQAVAIREVR
jgi:RND family efflux transporter MFP subunit